MNSVEFDPKSTMSFIIIHSLHVLGFPEKNEFLTDFLEMMSPSDLEFFL